MVQMPSVLVAKDIQQLIIHQMELQTIQNRSLEYVLSDASDTATGPGVSGSCTTEVVLADLHKAASTNSTLHQSRQKETGPTTIPGALAQLCGPLSKSRALLSFPHRLPQLLVYDSQMWNLSHNPYVLLIEPSLPSTSVGVLHVSLTIPDETTAIEFVVQDSGATVLVAVDRGRSPGLPRRPGD